MARSRSHLPKTPEARFPPSPPCACPVCQGFCARPGWWSVAQAARAVEAGLAGRIMLEIAPEGTFSVLSPAFRGNEGYVSLKAFENRGCTFLREAKCELHDTGLMPLECRFCHHDRPGQGLACHAALELDWNTLEGQKLVARWCRLVGFWEKYKEILRQAHHNPV